MRFKYCPKCGGGLEYKTEHGFVRPICQECGFVFYQNSKPTVSALIVKDEKVLLVKRAIDPHKGQWDIPGGFLENGEHPVDGLKREMKEELGVDIEVGELLNIVMDKYIEDDYDQKTLNISFLAKLKSDQLDPQDDISEFQWFALDNLPEHLAFSSGDAMLQALLSKLGKV